MRIGVPKEMLTRDQLETLAKLDSKPDNDIDTSDIPTTTFSENATRGRFYRPRKKSITIRLDSDVLAYYKSRAAGGKYQTEINLVLRQKMEEEVS